MTAAPAPRAAPELAIATLMAATAAGGYALASTGVLAALRATPGLHGTATEFLAIAARNTTVALAFLAAAQLRCTRRRPAMLAVDAIGLAVLFPVTLLVGQFLASQGSWRYFVHAPLELGALAAAYGWWWRHHETTPPAAASTARRALLVAGALIIAAAIETFLVPHRAS